MSRGEVASFVLGALFATASASIVALFFKGDSSQIWDILKLAIQGLGALLIAWLTVRWAIHTFKSQKSWERDATTYVDLVSALREMQRVQTIWWNEEIHAVTYTETHLKAASDRWNSAKAKFEESATRAIFLPAPIYAKVLRLEDQLANGHYDSSFEQIDHESSFVSEALEQLELMRDLVR